MEIGGSTEQAGVECQRFRIGAYQRRNMNRSIGVTVIAVLSMLGSLFAFAMGALMILVAVFLPNRDASMPMTPGAMRVMMGLASAMYILPAIWGAITSIGLFRLKNWARISTIVFSVLLAIMGLFGALTAVVMLFVASPSSPDDRMAMMIGRIAVGIFSGLQLGIGIWWLVFFTRPMVKAQFVPIVPANETATASQNVQGQNAPLVKAGPRRPVSITVIACLLLAGAVLIPMNLIMRAPAILFTKMFFGWAAVVIFLAFSAIQLYLGIGLLRLRQSARLACIAYFVFGAANVLVFFAAPGAKARTSALLEWQKSFMPFGQLSSYQSQFQPQLAPFLIMGVVVGVTVAAVQIYFLVTRKAAFEKPLPAAGLN